MTSELPILYQDERMVAVHKPSGMLVHRSAIAADAQVFALQTLRNQLGRHVYPVHRLDRPTSGLLLFALDPEMAKALGEEFTAHRVHKRYLAVVRGVGPEQDVLDYGLREEDGKRPKSEMPEQAAWTAVRRLDSVELPVCIDRYPQVRYSLMEAQPWTGRRHQIRRHLSRRGYPIIGDAKHGKGAHNRFFRDHLESPRLLLAAVGMTLWHPERQRTLHIDAPLADDMHTLFARFGWQGHATATRVDWHETRPVSLWPAGHAR
ncbi:tRNA pseudouridine(65) synthase TruC [Chromohalobacter sarecensis]|uniref:tRNA pseudouridine synthase C n=1 Tax=Chromohalobacter sarecensis TaxID=245294 RepID=A0ABV9D1R2_9GAMM|nr:tRNA pseudouridine(65) synthase TruC [Chromohalobacter sarecensis]MCK0715944.1 tRNA pseudouridine(65) synthase TruC [Chromohalobacter sarecensis]